MNRSLLPLTALVCALLPAASARESADRPDEHRGALTVFTVDSANDQPDANVGNGLCATSLGECTLRAALQEANALPDAEPARIEFAITSGPLGSFDAATNAWTIQPASTLPTVAQPNLTIDGLTQSDASCGNLVGGVKHNLNVVLDGSAAPSYGLDGSAPNLTVRGLVIRDFDEYGISVRGAGSLVECNYVGTDVTGEVAAANFDGVYLNGTARNNLVSGNEAFGIAFFFNGATVARNLLGTDADGVERLGNDRSGIYISGADATVSENVISANRGPGIEFDNGRRAVLTGNIIGLSRERVNLSLGNNGDGIELLYGSSGNEIGLPGSGNFIAANGGGISMSGGGANDNRIRGNTIGLDAAGNAAPNRGDGVGAFYIRGEGAPSGTIIGGSGEGDGNVIAGNRGYGVYSSVLGDGIVEGNAIGLNAAGAVRGNDADGVRVGRGVIRANVVSGNGGDGISAGGGCSSLGTCPTPSDLLIEGNLIGTDPTGTLPRGNTGDGIGITGNWETGEPAENVVIRDNVAAANGGAGIYLEETRRDVVEGNWIGTDRFGARDLGNAGNGVVCTRLPNSAGASNDSRIGGPADGQGNTIAFNGGNGVYLAQAFFSNKCQDVAVLRNRIYRNDGLGIDLAPDGVTSNDPGDADEGPNDLSNFPVLASAVYDGANVAVTFALDALPSTTYRVELFTSAAADPSAFGEGRTFRGSTEATTNGSGLAMATATQAAPATAVGRWVTATATPVGGSPTGFRGTSEFSRAVQIVAVGALASSDSAGVGTGEGAASAEASAPTGLPAAYALLPASPNPAFVISVLGLALPEPSGVLVEAFDVLGRRVATLAAGPMAAGTHRLVVDGSTLAAGLYVVRARVTPERGAPRAFAQHVTLLR